MRSEVKISLKEIIDGIKTLVADNVTEIKEVLFNVPRDIGDKANDTFPKMFLLLEDGMTIADKINQFPLTILVVDVTRGADDENERLLEVQSDCIQYLTKTLDLMQLEGAEFFPVEELNESVTMVESAYADGLSGVQATVNVFTQHPDFNV